MKKVNQLGLLDILLILLKKKKNERAVLGQGKYIYGLTLQLSTLYKDQKRKGQMWQFCLLI